MILHKKKLRDTSKLVQIAKWGEIWICVHLILMFILLAASSCFIQPKA